MRRSAKLLLVAIFSCVLVRDAQAARPDCEGGEEGHDDPSGPWCCLNHGWEEFWPVGSNHPVVSIPLYLHRDLITAIDCANVPCNDGFPSEWAIVTTLQAQLDKYVEYTRANIRIEVSPTIDEGPELTHLPGAIKLISQDVPGSFVGMAFPDDDPDHPNGLTDSCIVHIENALSVGPLSPHLLLHEVGHCLGMGHSDECGPGNRIALMDSGQGAFNHRTSSNLEPYDVRFLEAIYGPRSDQSISAGSTDVGATWKGFKLPGGYLHARGYAACDSGGADTDLFAFTAQDSRVFFWKRQGMFAPTLAAGVTTLRQPSLACQDKNHDLLAWIATDETGQLADERVRMRRRDHGTAVTSDLVSNGRGRNIDATFDPVSGHFVIVTVGNSGGPNRVHLQTEVASNNAGLDDFTVFDSASVACGPAAVGAENCILVFSDEWGPTLHWVHGHVSATTGRFVFKRGPFNFLEVHSNGFVSSGTPSVAYTGDPAQPFEVVVHQDGAQVYALRKAASLDANFELAGAFLVGQSPPWPLTSLALASWCDSDPASGVCTATSQRLLRLFGRAL